MNLRFHPVRAAQRAFTMIEIAIAIGVIGFALVAIIGILPQGMNVQKDNREDTIISQDAPYFINCIRNGEQRRLNGLLTNYVESIADTYRGVIYYNPQLVPTNNGNLELTSDSNIVGLLSTPKYDYRNPAGVTSNLMVATVRAMTGSATTQNGANAAVAFRYQMTVEVTQWDAIPYNATNYNDYAVGTPDYNIRTNRFAELPFLTNNLWEVRLTFAWPVLPNGNVGPGRQTYRTVFSSELNYPPGPPLWFFRPQYYTVATNAADAL